jgi:crotonobetainyl-CoA:carnitine CoA-transferase CaiB-like acyl-CoA transferase
VLGHGIRVNGQAAAPASAPPLLGEHTDALLTELGYTSDQISRFRTEGTV